MTACRRGVVALAVAAALVVAVPAIATLRQSPLLGSRPGPAAAGGESQPEWLRGLLGRVNAAQRQLNQTLSRELRQLREGHATGAALTVAWIAFLYGVLHAVGPGHGKLVVSSLFVAHEVRLRTALLISGLVSLLQTLSSIAIVSVVALVLGRAGLDVLRDSRRVELVCYGLILVIGLAMLVGALRELWEHRRDPAPERGHGAPRAGRGVSGGLVLATGLTPCASAVIILLFALGQGVFLAGVAAALVMAVGMGLTVAAVGLVAIAVRRGTIRASRGSRGARRWVPDVLAAAGAAAITAVGLVLLLAAWTGA